MLLVNKKNIFGDVPSTIFLTEGNFWETKFHALLDILVVFFSGGNFVSCPQRLVMGR